MNSTPDGLMLRPSGDTWTRVSVVGTRLRQTTRFIGFRGMERAVYSSEAILRRKRILAEPPDGGSCLTWVHFEPTLNRTVVSERARGAVGGRHGHANRDRPASQ